MTEQEYRHCEEAKAFVTKANADIWMKEFRSLPIVQSILKTDERIGRYILDGAHNEDAARELAASLEIYTTPGKTAFICGCFLIIF